MITHLEMQDIKVDEATAEYAAPTASHTQDEERAFIRRLDRRVLPWIMILYMVRHAHATTHHKPDVELSYHILTVRSWATRWHSGSSKTFISWAANMVGHFTRRRSTRR
jgi:hypothetical protein